MCRIFMGATSEDQSCPCRFFRGATYEDQVVHGDFLEGLPPRTKVVHADFSEGLPPRTEVCTSPFIALSLSPHPLHHPLAKSTFHPPPPHLMARGALPTKIPSTPGGPNFRDPGSPRRARECAGAPRRVWSGSLQGFRTDARTHKQTNIAPYIVD